MVGRGGSGGSGSTAGPEVDDDVVVVAAGADSSSSRVSIARSNPPGGSLIVARLDVYVELVVEAERLRRRRGCTVDPEEYFESDRLTELVSEDMDRNRVRLGGVG